MNWLSKTESFGVRLLRIMWLNFAIALAMALTFWAAHAKINHHSLSDELIASLVHSAIYGLLFGLAMPYLGERLAIIRAPWNWASIIAAILFIAVVSTLLVELSLLGLGFLSLENFWQEYFFKSLSVFFIALIIGSGINIYEKFRDRIQATNLQLRTQELEKERALKLVSEARLASLESRLHPHFLFNTLNSISALISEDPKLADEMVQRLASLLRTTLDACQQSDLMTLDKEIKLVTDYLEIEKVRFRERLRYSIDVEPEMMSVRVPPIILQPVVENSIKFAVAPNPAGGSIRISARREKNELVLEVWDNGTGFTSEMIPTGHGLDNLQSRLNTLFGGKAKLAFDSQNGETSVSVSLPLNGHQEIK